MSLVGDTDHKESLDPSTAPIGPHQVGVSIPSLICGVPIKGLLECCRVW